MNDDEKLTGPARGTHLCMEQVRRMRHEAATERDEAQAKVDAFDEVLTRLAQVHSAAMREKN